MIALSVLLFLASIATLHASENMVVLTDADFETRIKDYDIILVKFYAPWCGHCKRMAPEIEKAAGILKLDDPPVHIAKVDCTVETKTCGKYGVSGYPTLKIFKRGEFAFEYGGGRDADGIVKYMRSKSGPASRPISSLADLEKFVGGNDFVVVGFFDAEGSESHKTFVSLSTALSDTYKFAHVIAPSAEITAKHNYKNDIVVFQPRHLHSKFEPTAAKYSGDLVLNKLKSFVSSVVTGLAGHRTSTNAEIFTTRPLVVVYYNLDYTKDPKGSNYWRNRVMKVAEKYVKEGEKRVQFAVSSTSDFSHELDEFGLGGADNSKPFACARDSSDKKYKLSGEFTLEALEKFANDVLAGALEAYLKSEAVPEANDEPVKVVVGKTFDEIVNDPERDVLIEFYAPWCGHCKSLAPKYDELAKKLKDEPSITIAKMDATANDVPKPYEVHGFPTIYFAPKGKKQSPMQYNGDREVDKFMEWIAAQSTGDLVGFDRKGKAKAKKTEL